MAEKYKIHEQENRELKQKNADLEYQVGSLNKDLKYERSRPKSLPNDEWTLSYLMTTIDW